MGGMTTLSDFTATTLTGEERSLSAYAGKVVLVVNTASRCGFTPQYAGLEELYTELKDDGFVVLGFPCNQFGSQEPGSEDEIGEFCQANYGVTFPMFAKVDVNGDGRAPALRVAQGREDGRARRSDQVELHEVPGGPRRQGHRTLRPELRARRPRRRRPRGARRPGRLRSGHGSLPRPASAVEPTGSLPSASVSDPDVVVGDDGLARPVWASVDPMLRDYYDTEWGMPVRDERGMFERLSLEAFQSGLSWATILRKRPAFRAAFGRFDPEVVAGYGDDDVERLMGDAGIVRNRAKVLATITNARATLALRDDADGDLAAYVWSFRPAGSPRPRTPAEVPTTSPESVALSRALKRRGFVFVGPTTMYALMEAVGIVDTHLLGSHRRGSSGVWPG